MKVLLRKNQVRGKIYKASIIMFIFLCLGFQAFSSVYSEIERIEQKLGVRVAVSFPVIGSWDVLRYQICSDSSILIPYLRLMEREYSKYPKGYFSKIGIRTIAIGKELMINGQVRAAIPDPYKGVLFLSVDKPGDSETYQVHVMHHELHHCAEYRYWNSMNYHWDSWSDVNNATFNYQGSGASAYNDSSVDWYSINRPFEGFINMYSTTAQEEDRAEIVAIIMTDDEKPLLEKFLQNDVVLQQKVLLVKILLTNISGEEDTYWNKAFN